MLNSSYQRNFPISAKHKQSETCLLMKCLNGSKMIKIFQEFGSVSTIDVSQMSESVKSGSEGSGESHDKRSYWSAGDTQTALQGLHPSERARVKLKKRPVHLNCIRQRLNHCLFTCQYHGFCRSARHTMSRFLQTYILTRIQETTTHVNAKCSKFFWGDSYGKAFVCWGEKNGRQFVSAMK